MAWIESHQSLSRNKKLFRLCGLLETDKYRIIGHLHELWWWALDNVPRNGDLNDITETEIAQGAGWDGDSREFVRALTAAGFIDQSEEGRFLHDWPDYTARYYEHRDMRLLSSESGLLGNHERWHVRRGIKDPTCPYCFPPSKQEQASAPPPESPPNRGGESYPNRVPESGAISGGDIGVTSGPESGGRIGGEIGPESLPTYQPTNLPTNQPTARARVRDEPETTASNWGQTLDRCVEAWNGADPPGSKGLAAISVSRRKHCEAALKAGVASDFLIAVIEREAPLGLPAWKIRQKAVQEFRNQRPGESAQLAGYEGVPNAAAYQPVDPEKVREYLKLIGDSP